MKRTILFIATCCILAFCGFGQTDVRTLLDSVTIEKYPKADEVVVFDSTSVYVEETGLSHVYMHKLVKVLNEKGAKQNNLFIIDYDPLSAYVEIREVLIHRADGTTETVENKVCDYAAPARMIYWGASQKMVEIGRLELGDAIEVWSYKKGYTYALLFDNEPNGDDSQYIPPMKGHFYDIVHFWNNYPVEEKVYIVDIQTNKNLKYKIYHGDIEEKTEQSEERTQYIFTARDITPQKREPSMLAPSDVWTKLLLSTAPDWESKSLWFYGVNEDYGSFTPTPEVKKKVAELLTGAKSELDSISILTHWVADNMRYSGISMGTGEGYTLHNCEMNFTDLCGVCKDKAGLLIAMLRAAGFQSFAAMTMAGERIEKEIAADHFNHSVTVVKRRNGQYELLDPTWVPFVRELWSSAEQQQGYLMGVPEGATLMFTPISPAENHYFKMHAETTILKNGTLEGELVITAEGQTDAAVRSLLFTRHHHSEWDKNVEKELLQTSPRAVIISKTYTTTDNYLNGPVKITYKFRIPDYAVVTDKEIIFTPITALHPFKRALNHFTVGAEPETREYPFRDRCSRQIEITENVKLPTFKKVVYQPENVSFTDSAVNYSGGYDVSKNKISFSEKGTFGKRVYDIADWDGYRKAVQAQKNFETERIILAR
ncbi:MAG: DUF3857 and transglutaminase domain-containing protein [Bacteroidales bacterium]|nr:DUF3857 and transglutaminase domain-containing protein [Bacteroidales bacterium]